MLTWEPGREKVAGQLLELSSRPELSLNLPRSDIELSHYFLLSRHKKNHLACPMVLSQVLPDLVLDWASKYVGAQGEKSDNALEKTALGFRSKAPHIRATSLTKTK